jgi:transposase
MARYGQQFKERVVARLLPPESSSEEVVSQTVGISVGTLERWRAEVLARPSGEEARHWTPAARQKTARVRHR